MKTHMLETPGGFRIACGKFVDHQGAKTSDPAKVTCLKCKMSVTYHMLSRKASAPQAPPDSAKVRPL